MKIRCLLVDDEPIALDVLASYVGQVDALELVGQCRSAVDAFTVLRSKPIDLLFLDIQMPRLTGFDLLRPLGYRPKVIFTTAFREYALDSYEFDVVDFLVKPISFERFLQSVGKIYRFIPSMPSQTDTQETARQAKDYQYHTV